MKRCGQHQFIKGEIQPSAKFEAGLSNGAAMNKSKTLVEPDARRVGGVDSAHQNVIVLPLRHGDDFPEQTFPDPLSAEARVNVNGVLDRIFVSRPCPEWAVTGEPHQITRIVLDSDDGA